MNTRPDENARSRSERCVKSVNLLLILFSFCWWLYGIEPVLVDGNSSCNNSTLMWGMGFWYTVVAIMCLSCLACCCLCGLIAHNHVRTAEALRMEPGDHSDPLPPDVMKALSRKTWGDMKHEEPYASGGPVYDSGAQHNNVATTQPPPRSDTHQQYNLNLMAEAIGLPNPLLSSNNNTTDSSLCCSICTDKFEDSDTVIALPCDKRHVFHEACLTPWLMKSQLCPVCRANIVSKMIPESPTNSHSQTTAFAV
eukprot:GHVN01022687.1.p1 GENE.GHVN01022687.1~~GHVN01022687.1.p1  ORF type:complete len:283 (+),score=25.55 GHVN01022687.1:95-850(+)